jgi:hypothetical protein
MGDRLSPFNAHVGVGLGSYESHIRLYCFANKTQESVYLWSNLPKKTMRLLVGPLQQIIS